MDVATSTPSVVVSPLRQRMLDDMRMRQFAEHTQGGYIRAVRKLATFLGRSPHTAADDWLTDYNEYRPHDSLGNVPPAVFKARVFNQEVSTSGLST